MKIKRTAIIVFSSFVIAGIVLTRWAWVRLEEAKHTFEKVVENTASTRKNAKHRRNGKAWYEFVENIKTKSSAPAGQQETRPDEGPSVLDAGENTDQARWLKKEKKRRERMERHEQRAKKRAERKAKRESQS